MSLDNHDPRERAAFREAVAELAWRLGMSTSTQVENLLAAYPALPPLPTIERWALVRHGDRYPDIFQDLQKAVEWGANKDGVRVFRLAAVEEVTPTQPERVTLEGQVYERDPSKGWFTRKSTMGFDLVFVDRRCNEALDLCLSQAKRIAELEKGAGK